MSRFSIFCFDIQLFAEGGADGGTGAEGTTGVSAVDAAQHTGDSLANVKYGRQEASDAGRPAEPTDPDRVTKFKTLIKGEYKDLYDTEVQSIIQRRLKGTDEKVSRLDALTPTLELLARKYGVKADDAQGLTKAIEDDDAYYEAEALEKGLSVSQVKELRKMERENSELRRQMQEQTSREQAEKTLASWKEQEDRTKQVYPEFDLAAELKNPDFQSLVRSNIPVQTAFEVVHKDEIIAKGMSFAAKKVEQKVANAIIANGRRPSEGGRDSAAVVKSDVSQLTKADRREIIRRVQRGEKIVF